MSSVFTGTVCGSERAQRSVVATKGSYVVGLVRPDKIRPSEEVWSDCYKGPRSGAGEAVYSSRYQQIKGVCWGAACLIGIKESV